MAKRNTSPYVIPSKQRGVVRPKTTHKWDPIVYRAAKELAAEETKRYGRQIATGVLLSNLATRNTVYIIKVRKQLELRIEQLRKEQQHVKELSKEEQAVAAEFR